MPFRIHCLVFAYLIAYTHMYYKYHIIYINVFVLMFVFSPFNCFNTKLPERFLIYFPLFLLIFSSLSLTLILSQSLSLLNSQTSLSLFAIVFYIHIIYNIYIREYCSLKWLFARPRHILRRRWVDGLLDR